MKLYISKSKKSDRPFTGPIPTEPSNDITDPLYWRLWIIEAKAELAQLVNAQQLADFLAENESLSGHDLYWAIKRQIVLEQAHRLEATTCTCHGIEPVVCPVCAELADSLEMPY